MVKRVAEVCKEFSKPVLTVWEDWVTVEYGPSWGGGLVGSSGSVGTVTNIPGTIREHRNKFTWSQ